MMIAEMFILSDVIDNDGSAAITNFVADPPGRSPKAISSRTAQATQRSFVTLATAAKPIPVVRQTISRMDATASI